MEAPLCVWSNPYKLDTKMQVLFDPVEGTCKKNGYILYPVTSLGVISTEESERYPPGAEIYLPRSWDDEVEYEDGDQIVPPDAEMFAVLEYARNDVIYVVDHDAVLLPAHDRRANDLLRMMDVRKQFKQQVSDHF